MRNSDGIFCSFSLWSRFFKKSVVLWYGIKLLNYSSSFQKLCIYIIKWTDDVCWFEYNLLRSVEFFRREILLVNIFKVFKDEILLCLSSTIFFDCLMIEDIIYDHRYKTWVSGFGHIDWRRLLMDVWRRQPARNSSSPGSLATSLNTETRWVCCGYFQNEVSQYIGVKWKIYSEWISNFDESRFRLSDAIYIFNF